MVDTTLVGRRDAGLRAPVGEYRGISAEGITLHYGGPSPWPTRNSADWNPDREASIWRAWQAFHIDTRGWVDVAYTSCVTPSGRRFEGRGIGHRTAANGSNEGNRRSYAVVYLAGVGDPLTDAAKLGFLDEAHRLAVPVRWVHSFWFNTSCPGDDLRRWKDAGCPRPDATVPVLPKPVVPPRLARTRLFEVEDAVKVVVTAYPIPRLTKEGTGYWDLDGAPGRPFVAAGTVVGAPAVNGGSDTPDPKYHHSVEPFDWDGHVRLRLWGFEPFAAPTVTVTSVGG